MVNSVAKAYMRPEETEDCSPHIIEEYILEVPGSQGEVVDHIKLSILQRPATSEYLGELYMDKNHREGEQNGASCRFASFFFVIYLNDTFYLKTFIQNRQFNYQYIAISHLTDSLS